MPTIGSSRRRGPVSELKAPRLKPERRQAQLGGIPAQGVGGWSGKQPELPEKCRDFPEPEMFLAAELSGDPVIRTNHRVDPMTTGSGCG